VAWRVAVRITLSPSYWIVAPGAGMYRGISVGPARWTVHKGRRIDPLDQPPFPASLTGLRTDYDCLLCAFAARRSKSGITGRDNELRASSRSALFTGIHCVYWMMRLVLCVSYLPKARTTCKRAELSN
jgi:hypothetical protein